ncbi:hypothetical protein LM7416_110213 [Listeria monocytogenes]|nr:hypothetical protein LM7416_110213 [Listeria monocytogenes]
MKKLISRNVMLVFNIYGCHAIVNCYFESFPSVCTIQATYTFSRN